MGANKKTSTLSQADSLEKMGEFWDTHDFTEFDTEAPDVEVEVTCAVPVEIDLFAQIEQQAHQRGVSVETLVNLWLQQKVAENRPPTKGRYTPRTAPRQMAEKK